MLFRSGVNQECRRRAAPVCMFARTSVEKRNPPPGAAFVETAPAGPRMRRTYPERHGELERDVQVHAAHGRSREPGYVVAVEELVARADRVERGPGEIADELIRSRWDDPSDEARQQQLFNTDGFMKGSISQELPNGTWIRVDAGITRLLDCNGKLLGQDRKSVV